MRVRESAMGHWFQGLKNEEAIEYIAHCLYVSNGPDNVFWSIVEHHDLKAETPLILAAQVFERLMDFDLDHMRGDS